MVIKNAYEKKRDYVAILVTSKGEAFGVLVSHDQFELLERLEGKVHLQRDGFPYFSVKGRKNISLKTLLFGHVLVTYKNGNLLDLRPENIEKKEFDLEQFIKENGGM